MANKFFNKQVTPRKSYAVGGVVKSAVKAAAKSKAATKTKEIISRKTKEFTSSLGKAKEKMYKDLGLSKEYKAAKDAPVERPFGGAFREKMKSVEKKARKKLGIGENEGVFATYKKMREKYGLKGDIPSRFRKFGGKKVKGKTFQERADTIYKMTKENK